MGCGQRAYRCRSLLWTSVTWLDVGIRLAILDEASSALDLESEKAMYQVSQIRPEVVGHVDATTEMGVWGCYQLLEEVPGLTYVSVGHRPSLLAYHDTKLKLLGSGEYASECSG